MTLLLILIYLAFISLGLPDSMLGAAWPSLYSALNVPVGWAGIVSIIVSSGTVISSLLSEKLIRRLGTGRVIVISVAMTAGALLGISFAGNFWVLCLMGVPLGLGAGSVDCALNNYVALHYKARHMSWLHCFWGIGATLGPAIMGACLSAQMNWTAGYRVVGGIQTALVICLLFSLPLWRRAQDPSAAAGEAGAAQKPLGMAGALSLKGMKGTLIAFFCYCAVEVTGGLWAGSYMVLFRGISKETAATLSALFYFGITAGRLASGFVTFRLSDKAMVRLGQGVAALGVALMLIPGAKPCLFAGLVLLGVGCAPIYPSLLHMTPDRFGAESSQTVMGMQMASAYMGSTLMPPLFGLIAGAGGIGLFPAYLAAFLLLMILMSEYSARVCARENRA